MIRLLGAIYNESWHDRASGTPGRGRRRAARIRGRRAVARLAALSPPCMRPSLSPPRWEGSTAVAPERCRPNLVECVCKCALGAAPASWPSTLCVLPAVLSAVSCCAQCVLLAAVHSACCRAERFLLLLCVVLSAECCLCRAHAAAGCPSPYSCKPTFALWSPHNNGFTLQRAAPLLQKGRGCCCVSRPPRTQRCKEKGSPKMGREGNGSRQRAGEKQQARAVLLAGPSRETDWEAHASTLPQLCPAGRRRGRRQQGRQYRTAVQFEIGTLGRRYGPAGGGSPLPPRVWRAQRNCASEAQQIARGVERREAHPDTHCIQMNI